MNTMYAAAWLARASFHRERPAPRTEPVPALDTRPRRDYLLPDASFVAVIHDHGETPRASITYALAGGRIVPAMLAPIQRAEVEGLLEHARRASSARLRYLAEDALGMARAGCEPLTPGERCAAIRSCADALEMLRAMGVRIGGGR